MIKRSYTRDIREPRDLTDGRAFLRMQANRLPLSLIASMANVSEAKVMRLIELAEADDAKR